MGCSGRKNGNCNITIGIMKIQSEGLLAKDEC